MSWIFLSLLSAFGQAFGWALKKKSLEKKGVNNTLGLVSFAVAGIALAVGYGMSGESVGHLSNRFFFASAMVIVLNVLAAWTAYRALDKAALSKLMPFISLTALLIVPLEYVVRGTLPTMMQIVGIAVVVAGAILFSAKEKLSREALAVTGYFAVTVVSYSFTSVFMGVAVAESGSGLFSAAVFHVGIAFGFLLLVLFTNERQTIRELRMSGQWSKVLGVMVLAGLVIAFLENGPATVALESAKASEVFAIKRVMPFFALVLGIMMFGEQVTRRHVIGTALLVSGSMLIVWFR